MLFLEIFGKFSKHLRFLASHVSKINYANPNQTENSQMEELSNRHSFLENFANLQGKT